VLLLVVWIVVVVVAIVVLGGLLYSLIGAAQRLHREVEAVQRDLRPVLEQAQQVAARRSDQG
jgi:hypothetical protein